MQHVCLPDDNIKAYVAGLFIFTKG